MRTKDSLLLEGDPAILKATQGVKTAGKLELGEASLQTNLAKTTLPSAASLRPSSPIHCTNDNDNCINNTRVSRPNTLGII